MIVRILVTCLLLLVLIGCNDDPVSRVPKKNVKKVRPTKAKPEKKVSMQDVQEEIFNYSSIGQRDPFVSLLQKEKEARNSNIPKTPLEKFDLGQFRIQAILIGKGVPRAMVSAPDGKNYILKPGLKIGKNNGVIRDITRTTIVVEETTFDMAGNLIKGIQSITIPVQKTL